MPQKRNRRAVCIALAATALAALALAASASAKLTGEFTSFQQCPWTNTEVKRCLYSVTEGGEVVLGNKKVPIEKQVILQGGYTKAVEGFGKLVAAKNGITLSKAPQAVPGGLLGIVPDASSPALVKALIKFFFENSLTGVNSTLELAKPVNEVLLSELHLAEEEEVALIMPVKVHLENPFLGKSCFVGSSTSPIKLELTSGVTAPPGPNKPITGKAGEFEFLEEATVLRLKGAELVDNAWAAPAASGCGGVLSVLVNPIINSTIGLPSAAGKNTAILKNTIKIATAFAVKTNDETHP
jgi:hypothetical protein